MIVKKVNDQITRCARLVVSHESQELVNEPIQFPLISLIKPASAFVRGAGTPEMPSHWQK
jgi:hypothetical protein